MRRRPRCPRATAGGGPYSATVTTPVTPFSLRANAVVREPEIQQHWAEARVYETLSQENSGVSSACGGSSSGRGSFLAAQGYCALQSVAID